MKCRNCGATDARGDHRVFQNLGGKRRYHESNTRRYECLECGHRFVSVETYHRDVLRPEEDERIPRLPQPQQHGD